jgi:hypothetical protein
MLEWLLKTPNEVTDSEKYRIMFSNDILGFIYAEIINLKVDYVYQFHIFKKLFTFR